MRARPASLSRSPSRRDATSAESRCATTGRGNRKAK
nr:MAG TPA: hypothetical protein [Bacteriophage sp.]